MRSVEAFAKLNLALVVGPVRPDGKHEVVTVLQKIDLADVVSLEQADDDRIVVEGFDDSIVRDTLEAFTKFAGGSPGWRVRIEKRIPVAAGLGGGSSDAAAALQLANELVGHPLSNGALAELAARMGADVPFFLMRGTQLATGDGSQLAPLELPLEVSAVVVVPEAERKESTASVYARFDERGGATEFEDRRARLFDALGRIEVPRDLAFLPRNDLVASSLSDELGRLGAVRADVSGAGPAVYGLFEREDDAERAATELRAAGQTWLARPLVEG